MPRHAMLLGPCGHGSIAVKCPAIAGFFMAPKARNAVLLVDGVEDGNSIAH